MNCLSIIGNLTKDPELRTTQNGKKICSFTVAVNRHSTERDITDYFRVYAWDALADTCNRYLEKGSKVYARGRVTLNKYIGVDGNEHSQMQMDRIDEVEFLSRKQME